MNLISSINRVRPLFDKSKIQRVGGVRPIDTGKCPAFPLWSVMYISVILVVYNSLIRLHNGNFAKEMDDWPSFKVSIDVNFKSSAIFSTGDIIPPNFESKEISRCLRYFNFRKDPFLNFTSPIPCN